MTNETLTCRKKTRTCKVLTPFCPLVPYPEPNYLHLATPTHSVTCGHGHRRVVSTAVMSFRDSPVTTDGYCCFTFRIRWNKCSGNHVFSYLGTDPQQMCIPASSTNYTYTLYYYTPHITVPPLLSQVTSTYPGWCHSVD